MAPLYDISVNASASAWLGAERNRKKQFAAPHALEPGVNKLFFAQCKPVSIYHANACLTIAAAWSSSTLVMMSGGAKRIMASWVSLHSRPRSFSFSQ